MSKRVLSLPLRFAASSRPQSRQWICRRCLATQAESSSSSNSLPPMPAIINPSSSDQDLSPSISLQQGTDAAEPQHEPPPLSKTDKLLGQPLWHRVPKQYLQHSTSDALSQQEKMSRLNAVPHKDIVGVVVSAGKMDKTVKVRVPGQKWNQKLSKYFDDHTNHLVHDPNNSLVAGDVVSLHRLRVSKTVHHVVAAITAPFGKPIDARPPVPTPDERLAAYKERRLAKMERSDHTLQSRRVWRQAVHSANPYSREIVDLMILAGHRIKKGEENSTGESASVEKKVDSIDKLESLGFHAKQKFGAGSEQELGEKSGQGKDSGEQNQKLPQGILPGRVHEVGKIGELAKRKKGKPKEVRAENLKRRREWLRRASYVNERKRVLAESAER